MNALILYSKLGPYHLARLQRAGQFWSERGFRLTCIETARTQADYPWPRSDYAVCRFQYVSLFEDVDYWRTGYRKLRGRLLRALEAAKPAAVVIPGWGFKESAIALGWILRRGVPGVLISESYAAKAVPLGWKEWVRRSFVAGCQAGFAAGTPHTRRLAALGLPEQYCVAGAAVVDNDYFGGSDAAGTRRVVSRAPDCLRLLSCLRFLPRKNIEGTLAALRGAKFDVRWTLAGDGPERPNITRLIGALGLADRVRLPGFVDYGRLPELYRSADVYLQPSLSEPWGLAVNEAMAAGMPVLVSRQCGCREDLLREGVNGYSFDAESPGELVGALERIWAVRERWAEMGEVSRRIIAAWSLDVYAQRLWHACEMAIQRCRRPDRRSPWTTGLWKFA